MAGPVQDHPVQRIGGGGEDHRPSDGGKKRPKDKDQLHQEEQQEDKKDRTKNVLTSHAASLLRDQLVEVVRAIARGARLPECRCTTRTFV